MRSEDVQALYDPGYAAAYDERFLLGPLNEAKTEFELQLIRETLPEGGRWLDLGCGTGHVLAAFPGLARAGLDLSDAMVEMARSRNPDALFIDQGDFLAPRGEWVGQWDLVTCMWGAFSYVESLDEISQLLRNMIDWTAPGGAVLIPCIRFSGDRIPYRHEWTGLHGGEIQVHGLIWTWHDGDKVHRNLILPHTGQIIEWLAPFFATVRVVRYPNGRTAVLAQERRSQAPSVPSKILWDPGTEIRAGTPLGEASLGALLRELAARLVRGRLRRR